MSFGLLGVLDRVCRSVVSGQVNEATEPKQRTRGIGHGVWVDSSRLNARAVPASLGSQIHLARTSTVASVSPRTTVEPILALSARFMVTGSDSPVRADWSTSIYMH